MSAVAALQQLTKRLDDLAREPNGKRYQRDRQIAAAAWAEIRELGANRHGANRATERAKPRTRATPSTNGPSLALGDTQTQAQ